MADIVITPGSVLASSTAVIRREYTAAATITAGQVVYPNASNLWALADANAFLGTAVTDLRGIALNGASVGQPMSVVTSDPSFTVGGTVASGTAYYLSITAGGITATIPTTADKPVFLGLGNSATGMVLSPCATGVTI